MVTGRSCFPLLGGFWNGGGEGVGNWGEALTHSHFNTPRGPGWHNLQPSLSPTSLHPSPSVATGASFMDS